MNSDFTDMDMNFDLGIEINKNPKQPAEPKTAKKRDYKKARTQNIECLVRNQKNIYRRAFSESQLLDVVGEIFKGSYATEYIKLKEVVNSVGGEIIVFRNHSKVFAGYGKKFHFGIETSANINTNPRTENGCITIGKDIFDFYYDFYHKIKGFGK